MCSFGCCGSAVRPDLLQWHWLSWWHGYPASSQHSGRTRSCSSSSSLLGWQCALLGTPWLQPCGELWAAQ